MLSDIVDIKADNFGAPYSSARSKMMQWLMVLSVWLITACEQQQNVQLYKDAFKQGLLKICQQKQECVELVEQHFEQCIDDSVVSDMLQTALDSIASEKNRLIADQVMECITAEINQPE